MKQITLESRQETSAMNHKTSGELVLDNYKVLHKEDNTLWMLGRGEYGTTYKAEDINLGRIVALKVINDNLIQKDDIKARFLKEARAVAQLEHPNIANVYSCGETRDGIFYFAMKYCSGGDLDAYSRQKGPLSWSEVKPLALQILAGLKEAHDKGLLHRDLKPSNIMLEDPDEPIKLRLIDFGLVKVLETHSTEASDVMATQEGSFMGNVLTASPEQLESAPLDERSDLFSLGITLWYLLCGKSPFDGMSRGKVVHLRYSTENYTDLLPKDLPPSGQWILSKLLMLDRENRFSTAAEVIDAIQSDACDTLPIPANEEVPPPIPDLVPDISDDWENVWVIQNIQKQFTYGSYYACQASLKPESKATLFIPDPELPEDHQVYTHANQLLDVGTQLLNGFIQKGTLNQKTAYACALLPSGNFQHLLEALGHLTLQKHLAIFQLIATGVDEAIRFQMPGVELDVTDVLLNLKHTQDPSPTTPTEWITYFQKKKQLGENLAEYLEITILPKLEDSTEGDEDGEVMDTIGGDDLASNPVASFGGLLYRAISGMSVKQSAYMTPRAHVSTSHFSEKSNQYLSQVIAASQVPESAMDMLCHLCSLEGAPWLTQTVEAVQKSKDEQSRSLAQSMSSIEDLMKSGKALPTPESPQKITPLHTPPSTPSSPPPAQSTPPPPPSESNKQPTTTEKNISPISEKTSQKNKTDKKKLIFLVGGSLAACLLLGGGYTIYQRFNTSHSEESPSSSKTHPTFIDHGSEKLTKLVFIQVKLLGKLPENSPVYLQDHTGTKVATLLIKDGHATSQDFPTAIFADTSKWPLTLTLDSKGYRMNPVTLHLADFKSVQGVGREYSQLLTIHPTPYTEFKPVVQFEGDVLPGSEKWIKQYLTPYDTSVEWTLKKTDHHIIVTLESEHQFPIKALLTVPYFEEVTAEIGETDQVFWELKKLDKSVTLFGLGHFKKVTFYPDYSEVKDSAIRSILQKDKQHYTLTPKEIEDQRVVWKLPVLLGRIEITSDSGNWSAILPAKAKYRVFTQVDRIPGQEVHESEAFLNLLHKAEQGHADAQNNVGAAYKSGKGTQQNFEAAAFWFRIAAKQGNRNAQLNLSLAYENGEGVDKNPKKAFHLMKKLADQGFARAQGEIGRYYRDGLVVKKDYQEAEKWCLKAIEHNDIESLFCLATIYDEQADLQSSPEAKEEFFKKAVPFYQKAAEKHHAGALCNLGIDYYYGRGGLIKNEEKAKELIKESAEIGNPDAKKILQILEKAGE